MLKLFLLLFPIYLFAYPISDHYDGKKFFNPKDHELKTFWQVLKWKLTTDAAEWPTHLPNKVYPLPAVAPTDKAVLTFINHATFLVRFQNLTVLTDPIFSKRASPFSFMGPKRARDPGVALEELPPVDVVIISHNHYDHLDIESLRKLDAKFHPLFLVPLGDEKLLKENGIQNVREMDWWQTQQVKEVKIHFTPAKHWSARGLFDKCESLWGSYLIEAPEMKVYFGGDTGYSTHFTELKEKLGSPQVALLPIGAYEPRYFMKFAHMNPEEAVQAHLDLGAPLSIGMHLGTFQLTDEGIDDPLKALVEARLKFKVNDADFKVLDHGESIGF